MNGQTQSGGHWKAALGLMASGSVCFGFSGSGEESTIGTLFIMRDTPSRKVAVHQSPFRPRGEPQATHSHLPVQITTVFFRLRSERDPDPCRSVAVPMPASWRDVSSLATPRSVPCHPDQAAALLAAVSWLVGTSTLKFSTVGGPMMRGFINLTICA